MKKIVLFFFLFLSNSFWCIAQQREQNNELSFLNTSDTITNIMGWCHHEQRNKWIGRPNQIDDDDRDVTNRIVSGFNQNCIHLTISKCFFEGKPYYFLFVYSLIGHYEYPYLEEGYFGRYEYSVFVLNSKEYFKLCNPTERIVTLNISEIGIDNVIGNNDISNVISRGIHYKKKKLGKQKFTFKRDIGDKGEEVVRFNFSTNKPHTGMLTIYQKYWENLKILYFETTIEDWHKLVIKEMNAGEVDL